MAEPTENKLSTLYLPSIASTQPTIEEVAAENQRRRELDIEYGLTGGEYSSALANSQGRPLSDKDLAFHLEMLSGDQSVAGTDKGTLSDYLQDIGNFIKDKPNALNFKADGGELSNLDDGFLSEIADFINNNSQGVVDDLTKEGGLFGDTTFEREVANRRTDTPSFNPEKYVTRPLPEMSAINPDDRSIFSNLKGGGIEAVLLDKYPELENNPAFNLTRMIVPRTLGESAFELATMYPPLFWMKGLKAGSKGYNQAAKYQDEIDDFKNIIDREKRNQSQDRGPAVNAVFNNQQKIRAKESQILDILRKENPEYAADIKNTAEKKLAQEKLEADPLYAAKQRMAKNKNALVDQSSTLDKVPESELMPKGYKMKKEVKDDYNDQFNSVLDDLMSPKAPKKTDTDDLSIMELLERMKDMDLD